MRKGVATVEEEEEDRDADALTSIDWSLGGDIGIVERMNSDEAFPPMATSATTVTPWRSTSTTTPTRSNHGRHEDPHAWQTVGRASKHPQSMPMKVKQLALASEKEDDTSTVRLNRFGFHALRGEDDSFDICPLQREHPNEQSMELQNCDAWDYTKDHRQNINQKKIGKKTWRKQVKLTIDSGAAEHVVPTDLIPPELIDESEGQRKGVHYRAANGARIPNRGEKQVTLITRERAQPNITFQVTDVKKPLASVARVCDSGNRVILEAHGGYIENLVTGKRINLERENNTYSMTCDMMIATPGFIGQGK